MSANSSIQWTDATWNPVRGCTKVSPGCAHCYAETFAERFRGVKGHPYEQGFDLRLVPEKLAEPLKWRKPRRVFVNSMSDLFQDGVPFEFIDQAFAVMALSPQHTFQILTKRAERMREYFSEDLRQRVIEAGERMRPSRPPSHWYHISDWSCRTMPWPLANVWLGVSVENQHFADERIPLLLQTPAAVRFISAEPLLGPVDIGMSSATCGCCKRWPSRWVKVHREVRPQFPINLMQGADKVVAPAGIHRAESNQHGALSVNDMGLVPSDFDALPSLDWVIVGGESGPGARPFDIAWARSIVKQCADAKVACFVKQLGAVPVNAILGPVNPVNLRTVNAIKDRKGGDMAEWPADLRVRDFPQVSA
jgi:protein gp37